MMNASELIFVEIDVSKDSLDRPAVDRVLLRPLEGFIQSQNIDSPISLSFDLRLNPGKCQFNPIAAAFFRAMHQRMVHQNLPHRARRNSMEMSGVLPFQIGLYQFEIGLVHQARCRQSMISTF